MDKSDAERAIRSFFLYQLKYYKNNVDAFTLPEWFVEARHSFTREEIQKMYNEEKGLL